LRRGRCLLQLRELLLRPNCVGYPAAIAAFEAAENLTIRAVAAREAVLLFEEVTNWRVYCDLESALAGQAGAPPLGHAVASGLSATALAPETVELLRAGEIMLRLRGAMRARATAEALALLRELPSPPPLCIAAELDRCRLALVLQHPDGAAGVVALDA
jgi:hypothetical protein